jgi:hypothetical protein
VRALIFQFLAQSKDTNYSLRVRRVAGTMSHRRSAAGSVSSSMEKKGDRLDPETLPFVGSKSSNHGVVGSLSLESGDGAVSGGGASDHTDDHVLDGPGDEELDPEQRFEVERHLNRIKHWREHPFAVGLVPPTWRDEQGRTRDMYGDHELQADETGCLCCTAHACAKAGRVGNMVVLKSSTEWVEEVEVEEDGEEKVRRYPRPRLDCVVGPYWPMMAFVTYPLILGVSGWTLFSKIIPGRLSFLMVFGWAALTIGLITALAFTACCDPGIQYKHHKPPSQHENQWRWTDRAHSYRPRNAFYDVDTGVIVEGFDHTYVLTPDAI